MVAYWKLKSNENILKSLLVNRMDAVAAEVGHEYNLEQQKPELLNFAIKNANETFLKNAFNGDDPFFTPFMLKEGGVIENLMNELYDGSEIELCLNILIFAPIEDWYQEDVERLLGFI